MQGQEEGPGTQAGVLRQPEAPTHRACPRGPPGFRRTSAGAACFDDSPRCHRPARHLRREKQGYSGWTSGSVQMVSPAGQPGSSARKLAGCPLLGAPTVCQPQHVRNQEQWCPLGQGQSLTLGPTVAGHTGWSLLSGTLP